MTLPRLHPTLHFTFPIALPEPASLNVSERRGQEEHNFRAAPLKKTLGNVDPRWRRSEECRQRADVLTLWATIRSPLSGFGPGNSVQTGGNGSTLSTVEELHWPKRTSSLTFSKKLR